MTDPYIGPDRRGYLSAQMSPWVLPGLALVVLLIFAGALVASIKLDDNTLRTQMFTGAYGLATLVMGYFFGNAIGKAKQDDALAATAIKQNETIADQGKALAASAPAQVVTTTTVDPGPPATATTTTAPVEVPVQPPPAKG